MTGTQPSFISMNTPTPTAKSPSRSIPWDEQRYLHTRLMESILLQVQRVNGTNKDILESITYNSQHLPLTMVDASGQTNYFGVTPMAK